MNYNWPKNSNLNILDILEKNIAKDSLANFYIFSGPKALGKFSIAQAFAKNIFIKGNSELMGRDNILDISPDFFLIEKEDGKKNISIEQVRDLISRLSLSSFLNSYKVVVIKNGENLNQSSANALLKLLEEFKTKMVVIMTTDDISAIPKTIISRSRLFNFSLASFDFIYDTLIEDFKLKPSEAKIIAKISAGRISLAYSLINNLNEYIETVKELASFFSIGIHQRVSMVPYLVKEGEYSIIEIWETIVRDLMLLSVNKGELVQNSFIIDDLRRIEIDGKKLQQLEFDINKAKDYIKANMNIKSVLEYIAVNV
ncbi:MAG: AAA family ATPase [Patescibacteria group bacterium]